MEITLRSSKMNSASPTIMKHSWSDITINEFYELKKIKDMDNEVDALISLYALLCNTTINEIRSMPYTEFQLLTSKKIKWLAEPINDKIECKKKYVINDTTYRYQAKPFDLTTSQFLDLQQVLKNINEIETVISIVLIPEGKKYGEYDIDEVKQEIRQHVDIETAKSIVNFLLASTTKSLKTILLYLQHQLKKMGKNEKDKKIKTKLMEADKQIRLLVSMYG